jgi:hypothetical protein
MKRWRKIVASQGTAQEHHRAFESDAAIPDDRPTDPVRTGWAPEGPFGIRPASWSLGFARTRFESWSALRGWVAVKLARMAARIAP